MVARRVLDQVSRVPTPVWGRDELQTGEMWNSNSIIAWTLLLPVSMPKKFVRPLADARQAGTPEWSPPGETVEEGQVPGLRLRLDLRRWIDRSRLWQTRIPTSVSPKGRYAAAGMPREGGGRTY